jgi:hypothetical protein
VTLPAEDRLDILELLARADNAATRRDVATYVALFSDNGVLDGDQGEHRGHQALAAAVAAVWSSEGRRSLHLTLNAVIDQEGDDPERATATSVLLIVDPGPPPTLANTAAITQHVVKTGAGWRISRRTVGRP